MLRLPTLATVNGAQAAFDAAGIDLASLHNGEGSGEEAGGRLGKGRGRGRGSRTRGRGSRGRAGAGRGGATCLASEGRPDGAEAAARVAGGLPWCSAYPPPVHLMAESTCCSSVALKKPNEASFALRVDIHRASIRFRYPRPPSLAWYFESLFASAHVCHVSV